MGISEQLNIWQSNLQERNDKNTKLEENFRSVKKIPEE